MSSIPPPHENNIQRAEPSARDSSPSMRATRRDRPSLLPLVVADAVPSSPCVEAIGSPCSPLSVLCDGLLAELSGRPALDADDPPPSTQLAPLIDQRGVETAPPPVWMYDFIASDEQAAAALQIVSSHHGLVKTVRNGDWLRLLQRYSQPPFRTSFTLLPPTGRMHLFGSTSSQVVGLLVDRRQLDLRGVAVSKRLGVTHRVPSHELGAASVLCWPSGYFAKTEHHMDVKPDGQCVLSGGRWQQLVALEEIEAANLRSQNDAEPLLYNEISLPVSSICGVCAVFVRTSSPGDALFAMGVRALLQHVFPMLPPIQLLRITAHGGASIVTRQEQLELLRSHTKGSAHAVQQRLPVDTFFYPELEVGERLALHTAHGISRSSLRATLIQLGHAGALAHQVARCLAEASVLDNVASARELVRTAAPLLLEPLLVRSADGSRLTLGVGEALVRAHAAGGADGGGLTACVAAMADSVSVLQRACTAKCSQGMLVTLGAQITICEFVAGRTARRLEAACKWLQDWIWQAEQGPCSYIFRMSSWLEARQVDGNSDWYSFISGKAVRNRKAFHAQLTSLLHAQQEGDGLKYVAQLYALSSRLRRPCLRLRILQQVLGLDTRFSRDIVHGVVCLAFDVLEELSGGPVIGREHRVDGAAEPPPFGRFDSGPEDSIDSRMHLKEVADCSGTAEVECGIQCLELEPSAVGLPGLDSYDESTRLEADALFGTGRKRRPSDPIGEESRQARVLYYYR